MKNIIFSLVLVLGLAVAPVAHIVPEEAPVAVAVEDVGSSTDAATVPVPVEEPTAPAEKAAEEVTNPWVSLIWVVVGLLIVALGGSIKMAGKLGLKKLEKKLGFDVPDALEEIAEGYLTKGINWTENWAKKQADKPRGEDKMAETIRYAVEKAGENEALRKKIEEKGKAIVERLLKSKDTPKEATPKAE